ncbi:MAG TPA: type II toxin-antitoxin system HicA family toxin [Paludibaculum sp.]
MHTEVSVWESGAGRITVPGHPSDDLNPNTLKSFMIQAGLQEERKS